jgi:peptidoglycan-N-acetylglucosamine deacetylase
MKKTLVTTSWDDGHMFDLRIAELLKKYDLAGTFYVSPKCREFKYRSRLNDQEIRQLASKFEVGAHTMTHPRLTSISLSEAKKEIQNSKYFLERVTGKKIVSFCYPGGEFNKKHKMAAKEIGFFYARTVNRLTLFPAKDYLAAPTTIHCYKHYRDLPRILILANFNPVKFWKLFSDWGELAKSMFDKSLKFGGTYHLWGHSWEIDNNNDWDRLERVFQYISRRHNALYITNKELASEK